MISSKAMKGLGIQMSMLCKMSSSVPDCEPDCIGYRSFNCKYQMHKGQHEIF